jgi:GTPase Era involved in 16S rRNA processing
VHYMNLSDRLITYTEKLSELKASCHDAQIEFPESKSFEYLLKKNTFDIAFVGEFSSGKTTIVNAFLGEDILPTKLDATTARITYISYGEKPEIRLRYKDGTQKTFAYSSSFLKELTASNNEAIEEIQNIYLYYPAAFLKNSIRFIDTPGTNDPDEQRVEITYRLLPKVDAVVYVTTYPITESDLESYETHIMKNQIGATFYCLNCIDRLGSGVDEASEDAQDFFEQRSGGAIQLYSISALDYLEGFVDGDDDMIAASRFDKFSEELITYLNSSDKFRAREGHIKHHFDLLKGRVTELLNVQLSSLVLPEEEFASRQDKLGKDLAEYEVVGMTLQEDINGEFDRLVTRLSESVESLFQEILEKLDMSLQASSGEDSKLMQRRIEMGLRSKFEEWRMRNEPVIRDYVATIQGEIQIRLGQVSRQIEASIAAFSSETSQLITNEEAESTDPISKLISDPKKAHAAMGIASVGTYSALALAGVSIAPVAMLIAPLGFYWMQKKKKEEIATLKLQLMTELRKKRFNFRDEVLQGIKGTREQLISEVSEQISLYSKNIKNQVEDVDRQRDSMMLDIESSSMNLRSIISKVEAL